MFKALVTFDTDAVNQNNRLYDASRINFEYDRELGEVCAFLADNGVKATAFVRVDQQLKKYFDYLYLVEKVQRAIEHGGRPDIEIAWHPHIYALKDDGADDVARDEQVIVELLEEVYAEVEAVRGMKCVRLGGTQGGNLIMKTLDGFGFAVDSSANPGRRMHDAQRHFDWSRATNAPYHPSMADYQAADDQASRASGYAILEVPITTIPLKAPYDSVPKARAINPCYRPELFAASIRENERDLKEQGFCVMLFHPDELIAGYSDDLLCYGFENFRRNFDFFQQTLGDIEFETLGEFGKNFETGERPLLHAADR